MSDHLITPGSAKPSIGGIDSTRSVTVYVTSSGQRLTPAEYRQLRIPLLDALGIGGARAVTEITHLSLPLGRAKAATAIPEPAEPYPYAKAPVTPGPVRAEERPSGPIHQHRLFERKGRTHRAVDPVFSAPPPSSRPTAPFGPPYPPPRATGGLPSGVGPVAPAVPGSGFIRLQERLAALHARLIGPGLSPAELAEFHRLLDIERRMLASYQQQQIATVAREAVEHEAMHQRLLDAHARDVAAADAAYKEQLRKAAISALLQGGLFTAVTANAQNIRSALDLLERNRQGQQAFRDLAAREVADQQARDQATALKAAVEADLARIQGIARSTRMSPLQTPSGQRLPNDVVNQLYLQAGVVQRLESLQRHGLIAPQAQPLRLPGLPDVATLAGLAAVQQQIQGQVTPTPLPGKLGTPPPQGSPGKLVGPQDPAVVFDPNLTDYLRPSGSQPSDP